MTNTPPGRGGQRILLFEFDLFGSVGGGQTVYRRLIALRPQDTFYYFAHRELPDAVRPANAVAIPLLRPWRARSDAIAANLRFALSDYVLCRNLAASCARHRSGAGFDVVDVPDYRPVGAFVRGAFAQEGVPVGVVALALHGNISASVRGNWPTGSNETRGVSGLRLKEGLSFRSADARYAISESYASAWRRRAPLPVNALDPLCITGGVDLLPAPGGHAAPDLVFVGRREKSKGPDLFLDLAWCLEPSSYGRFILAGPDGPNRLGQGSGPALAAIARRRGLRPELPGNLDAAAMHALLAGRSLLFLPSRHDTFNLTALEALLRGCPTIVSDRAGVATWLRARLPELDWLVTGVDCSRTAAGAVAAVLCGYDACRAALIDAMSRGAFTPDFGAVGGVYDVASTVDVDARQSVAELDSQLARGVAQDSPLAPLTLARTVTRRVGAPIRTALAGPARVMLPPLRQGFDALPRPLRITALLALDVTRLGVRAARHGSRTVVTQDAVKDILHRRVGTDVRTLQQYGGALRRGRRHRFFAQSPERTTEKAAAKLAVVARMVPSGLVDRVALFREMARLERRLGRDLIAATYALRTMRWLDGDPRGELPFVTATLSAHGFAREATVAQAMFGAGDAAARTARCLDLMRDAYAAQRRKPELPLAVHDNRRDGATAPRVAVIASLYNAADKLPTLLAMLGQQTLARRGELEVVLIDSGSPSDERGAFEAFTAANALPVLYARSAERETIQAAWNRGIRLARAPYLAFLGADEGLHPDALRQLAAVLDTDASVDWAMADSVVTDVDRGGVYAGDVMAYDRTGYAQDLTYLDTTYLSWVGGLYRRSIHDRFGFYDESFRAAGDTEFKSRVLPHIRTRHLPRMLGVFNNYPEERTTQHPRAEIEDLRAWYLWRTEAGMRYAFDQRPAADAVALLRACLGYRKCFLGYRSTDFDLAHALAGYLATRADAPRGLLAAPAATGAMLSLLRGLEQPDAATGRPMGGLGMARWLRGRLGAAAAMAAPHQALFGLEDAPAYGVFNDNRYEQHWWSWSSG